MIDLAPYDGKLSKVIDQATSLGIHHFLCVSCDPDCHRDLCDIAEAFEQVSLSVGLHPTEKENQPIDAEVLLEQAKHPKVIAIGETGLDYFHCKGDLQWQHDRFETHVAVAQSTELPIIVHTREAKQDTLAHLKKAYDAGVRGVLHCFTEDWDMAKQAIDLGFMISFSGIVTFKSAKIIQEAAQKVPNDAFLVETDSPFLAPTPYRGKPNIPGYVYYVAKFIAELRQQSEEEIARLTTNNFKTLFSRAVLT
jgi:TatD DNase family protein